MHVCISLFLAIMAGLLPHLAGSMDAVQLEDVPGGR